MKKRNIVPYNQLLVEADRDFLTLMIKYNNVNLIENSGLHLLLRDVQKYLDLSNEADISIELIKPVMVLNILTDMLKNLWVTNTLFQNQLKAMNSGEFQYGHKSPQGDHYFKDFELELFTASLLIQNKLPTVLPQNLDGNDVICEDIEIQCKHPNTINRSKIDKYLRTFNNYLKTHNKYGVFGIGLDDYIGFTEEYNSLNDEEFISDRQRKLSKIDNELIQIFDNTLKYTPRVLGFFSINTHFIYTPHTGLTLAKMANSVLCLHDNASGISEETLKNVYKILMCFNDKPSIRNFTVVPRQKDY